MTLMQPAVPLRPSPVRGAVIALLLALSLLLGACEEDVNPLLPSDRYYSLYGFLNMNSDTQFIRVDEIRPVLRLTDPSPLSARVTSTDLETGSVVAWHDSVFSFRDGTFAHIFIAPLRVIPTHTYRIEVERADGATTSVETTVPPRPTPRVMAPAVRIIGQATLISQTVVWEGLDRAPDSAAVWYRFYSDAGRPFLDESLPTSAGRMEAGGWVAEIPLTLHADSLRQRVGRRTLLGMGMTVIVRDDAWRPPGEGFDPRVLSQPGVFSNVVNGFGFVGSAGSFSAEWVLDPVTANQLGYPLPGKTGGLMANGQWLMVNGQ